MVGGVAEGAKSGTSVLEKDEVWQRPQGAELNWEAPCIVGEYKPQGYPTLCAGGGMGHMLDN